MCRDVADSLKFPCCLQTCELIRSTPCHLIFVNLAEVSLQMVTSLKTISLVAKWASERRSSMRLVGPLVPPKIARVLEGTIAFVAVILMVRGTRPTLALVALGRGRGCYVPRTCFAIV